MPPEPIGREMSRFPVRERVIRSGCVRTKSFAEDRPPDRAFWVRGDAGSNFTTQPPSGCVAAPDHPPNPPFTRGGKETASESIFPPSEQEWRVVSILFAVVLRAPALAQAQAQPEQDRLEAVVKTLCSPEMEGRRGEGVQRPPRS